MSNGRPFCCVSEKGKPCTEISDYIVCVPEIEKANNWETDYEQFELCFEHHKELDDVLKRTVLSKIPDKDKEKVQFT